MDRKRAAVYCRVETELQVVKLMWVLQKCSEVGLLGIRVSDRVLLKAFPLVGF